MSHWCDYQVTETALTLYIVWRFRTAQSIATGAPLSEPAQKITAEVVDGDLEKEGDVRVEASQAQFVVHQEDEQFEWREVVRGWC